MRLTEGEYAALPGVDASGLTPVPHYMRDAGWWHSYDGKPEASFQAKVIELAKIRGWLHYHTFRSDRSPSGFPDLVMVRDRVLYRELKARRGAGPSMAQREWLKRLTAARADAKVWRPSDWTEILDTLF